MSGQVDQQVHDWWLVAELAIAMADATPELHRLRNITSNLDGFGNGSTDRGGPGTIANPTLGTILKLAGGKEPGDQVAGIEIKADTPDTWAANGHADRIAMLLGHLNRETTALFGSARRIAGIKRLIEGRGDSRVGRQSSLQADCLCCEADVSGVGHDRLKSGYCPACWTAWVRYRAAEQAVGRTAVHEVFRRRRRRELERAS